MKPCLANVEGGYAGADLRTVDGPLVPWRELC
jgi:hypothetical protein